jgi:4-amino-4-deoxy-L-arabinose transferase-like glycosyltransferase
MASLWTPQTAALLLLVAIAVFFRGYRLAEVPPEMNSDHVEKLLDVHDVVTDKPYIFFERNTGREPMQFYLVTAIIRAFDTGLTFYSLKLSNFVMGMLTIFGVYLLGREVGGRRVAWVAAFFAAVALWSFAPSRVGLRYPFAPAFTSLALWSLWRALRSQERKDWLVGGLMLGLGLHGYTSFRIMPLAVTLTLLLKIALDRPLRWQQWRQYVQNFTLYVATSALVFLPLARYWYNNPDMFWYRSLTRSTSLESEISEPLWSLAGQTFLRTLGMFHWVGDNVFVSTIAGVPVLNPITNGFFVIGLGYTLVVLSRQRRFAALALLLNGFMLLMPSMLNFAFPNESPSVVRTGSAIPVIAVIFALGARYVYQQFAFPSKHGRTASAALVGLLLVAIAVINYNRYFGTYLTNYQQSSMNTAEVSAKMNDFLSLVGDTDQMFMKGWPHWLDTRSLGIQLGDVDWYLTHGSMDMAPLIERAPKDGSPILFVVHPDDMESSQSLKRLYPNSFSITYRSATPGHDYIFVVVPATEPLIYEP